MHILLGELAGLSSFSNARKKTLITLPSISTLVLGCASRMSGESTIGTLKGTLTKETGMF